MPDDGDFDAPEVAVKVAFRRPVAHRVVHRTDGRGRLYLATDVVTVTRLPARGSHVPREAEVALKVVARSFLSDVAPSRRPRSATGPHDVQRDARVHQQIGDLAHMTLRRNQMLRPMRVRQQSVRATLAKPEHDLAPRNAALL